MMTKQPSCTDNDDINLSNIENNNNDENNSNNKMVSMSMSSLADNYYVLDSAGKFPNKDNKTVMKVCDVLPNEYYDDTIGYHCSTYQLAESHKNNDTDNDNNNVIDLVDDSDSDADIE